MQLCRDISSALVSQNVEINNESLFDDLWEVSNIESPILTLEDNGKIKKYRVIVSQSNLEEEYAICLYPCRLNYQAIIIKSSK